MDQGSTSFWSFCIDYLDQGSLSGLDARQFGQRRRVDYREILSAEEFALFSRLRDLRKDIAQADGVPVYTVFNNEQLAQMVQKAARTKADLEAIAGVGDARVEKYGSRFLEFLAEQRGADEADGTPV